MDLSHAHPVFHKFHYMSAPGVIIGYHSSRVETFLLSALKEKTLELYVRALNDFKGEVDVRGFVWASVSPPDTGRLCRRILCGSA